ncbi:phospholipase-like protein, partial [Tanacetum coccineum]
DSTVNLDLTPTKSEHQSDWYKFFREYYTTYVPRSAPTRYPDLFDDYLKKFSASRKRGKLDTRDLPIIRRCDTTSVEEIRVKDCVISQLNSRVYKLETIIKVLGRERKGVLLDYLIQEEFRVKQEEEERCRLEELKMQEALFLSSLKEEFRVREEKKLLKYEEDKKKKRHGLMNSDHWKVSRSKITNGKRSQRSGAFSAYYWGDTFVNAEKDRPLNALNDQDMTQFLKDVTPWVEVFRPLRARFPWCKDVSVDRRFWETLVCLDPRKKGWIIDEHVELWVNYMWHVRPQDADWAMVGGYFVQLLLQDTIPLWYVDGSRYKVAWNDVDQVFMPINETDQHWCLAQFDIRTGVITFYDSGITYDPEWPESLDPTIVKISYPYSGLGSWFVSVYTVSTDRWIRLQNLPSEALRIKHAGQAVIGNFIYWSASDRIGIHDDGVMYTSYVLISFDMVTHQFQTIVIPEMVIAWLVAPFFISQLGNNLVVSTNYLVGEGRLLCGWILGVDGYSVTSYRMVVSVNTPYSSKLVGFNNDEEPIIEVDDTGYQMDTWNGYLRKGRKTKPKRQNQTRNGKAWKRQSQDKAQV